MIKKISQIKSFGIYKDFNWGNLPEFTSKNLIYGWNYSGKTTLSRLFACLEHRCLIDDFHEGQFEIVLSDNSLINSNNLPKAPIPNVKVFNEDFIQKNLKWSGESFTPILLLGENSIEKSNLITELEQRIDVLRKKQAESKKNSTEVEEQYEQDLTNLASNIKDILRLGTYTKTHVKKEINNISSNDFLKDEDLLQGLLISATTDDNLDEIVEFTTKVDSKILQHEVDELLQKVPQIAQSIEEYENDAELSNWVEKGLSIHANSQTCKFCNSTLTLERLAILNNYFSKEYKDLHSKIKALIDKLKDSTITISLPDENRFHKEFRVKYTSTRSRVSEAISIINNTIYLWLEILNKKLLNTFEKFTLPGFQEIELLQELDELNQIITSHNKKCREFELQKKTSIIKAPETLHIKIHYREKILI